MERIGNSSRRLRYQESPFVMKKIAIYVASLEHIGGGERFVYCLRDAFEKSGQPVTIICDRFNATSTFNGQYSDHDIIELSPKTQQRKSYLGAALQKLSMVMQLRRTLKTHKIDNVICQSEFDAIRLWMATAFSNVSYSVYVFGQTFQFAEDITKYARRFRKHLDTILDSRPGYRITNPGENPVRNPVHLLINELLAKLKYRALRKARYMFTLSHQVKWETELMIGKTPIVLPAAIWQDQITAQATTPGSASKGGTKHIVSICRLVPKKRVATIVGAMAHLPHGFHLDIVGDGPCRADLETACASQELQDRITFHGAVNDADRDTLLSQANCFISFDIADYDITVFEALAMGIPVVVSDDYDLGFEGAQDLALTASKGSTEALAHTIESFPSDADYPKTVDVLKNLTWENAAESMLQLMSQPQ